MRNGLGTLTGGMSETGYGRELQEDAINYISPRLPWWRK
jgi:hypothetical protein